MVFEKISQRCFMKIYFLLGLLRLERNEFRVEDLNFKIASILKALF